MGTQRAGCDSTRKQTAMLENEMTFGIARFRRGMTPITTSLYKAPPRAACRRVYIMSAGASHLEPLLCVDLQKLATIRNQGNSGA